MSLAAPPMPTGRMVAAGAHEYHVTTLGEGDPAVFLHGGGPGCTGMERLRAGGSAVRRGPSAASSSTCCSTGSRRSRSSRGPMWDYHADSIVELLDALRHRARRPRVQLVGRHDRARSRRRATPSAPARSSSPVRCPSSTASFGATARGWAAGPERPRPLLRRRRSVLGEDARSSSPASSGSTRIASPTRR